MTLSLDDVRNKRFRMARKSGYEVLEVDEFVDEVEETFGQLFEENQNLKKQVEALKSAPQAAGSVGPGQPSRSGSRAPAAEAPPPSPGSSSSSQPVVVTTSKEASTAVVRLVELSTEQAERLVDEANEEANQIREEANRTAHQVSTDARTRAERVESEARVNAERLQADALGPRREARPRDREPADRDVRRPGEAARRADRTVAALRTFESTYRTNLTNHLRSQIEALEAGAPSRPTLRAVRDALRPLRPGASGSQSNGYAVAGGPVQSPGQPDRDDAPTLGGGSSTSDTPRLDALLGDQR